MHCFLRQLNNRLGNQAFAEKNYADAIQHYSQAITLDPSNHVFYSNRSASHAGLGDWDLAAVDAKECIRLDPSFLKGYFRLATAQLELQDYPAAMATLRQGLSMDATHPQLLKLQRTVQQRISTAGSNDSTNVPAAPNSNVVLDDATKREYQDLQMQHSQTMQEYNAVQANLLRTQRESKVHQLTTQELQNFNLSTGVYRSVGKLFLRSNQERVASHLQKQQEDLAKREVDLTQKIEYLQRRIKSQRQNMEELIAPSAAE